MRAWASARRLAPSAGRVPLRSPTAQNLLAVRRRPFQLQADAGLPPLPARLRTAALACATAATISGASVASVAVWRERKGKNKGAQRFGLFNQLGGGAAAGAPGWWQAARSVGIDPRQVQGALDRIGLLDGAIGPIMMINTAVYLLWCVAPTRVMQRHFLTGIRGPPW